MRECLTRLTGGTRPFAHSPVGCVQPDRVMEFCKNNDLQLIVRAHECVMDGFERFAQGHLITLFSATNYCGKPNPPATLPSTPIPTWNPPFFSGEPWPHLTSPPAATWRLLMPVNHLGPFWCDHKAGAEAEDTSE